MALREAGLAAAMAACWVACGCSTPMRRGLAGRGRDLGDCFKATAGIGLPVYGSVRATDFVVTGCGLGWAHRVGWVGRKDTRAGGDLASEFGEVLAPEAGIPFAANFEKSRGRIAGTLGPCVTLASYTTFRPRAQTRFADRFWVGAKATLLVSTEVAFNPVEFADFLVGWAGWDLLRDDVTLGEVLAAAEAGDLARVERLLRADPELLRARDIREQTLFHWAAWCRDTRLVALLLDLGVEVDATDMRGDTPLLWTLKRLVGSQVRSASLLLAHGADVNARDKGGRTALHCACLRRRYLIWNVPPPREVAALLIENGADINAKDSTGATPLHLAARAGGVELAELFIAHGADVTARDDSNQTPLDVARHARHRKIVKLLRAHGAR